MINIDDLPFKEVKKLDLEYCKKIIKNNLDLLYFNLDSCAWCIDDVEIVDELWYEWNTYIHPKELIGSIEEDIIKKDLGIKVQDCYSCNYISNNQCINKRCEKFEQFQKYIR